MLLYPTSSAADRSGAGAGAPHFRSTPSFDPRSGVVGEACEMRDAVFLPSLSVRTALVAVTDGRGPTMPLRSLRPLHSYY